MQKETPKPFTKMVDDVVYHSHNAYADLPIVRVEDVAPYYMIQEQAQNQLPVQPPIQPLIPHVSRLASQPPQLANNNEDPEFMKVYDAVVTRRVSCLLIGAGGCGKSFIIRKLVDLVNKHKITTIAVTATTGVAAVNVGGQTLHRFFGVGLARVKAEELLNKIRYTRKDVVKRILETNILIIDEVSMLSKELWDKLDYICKKIRKDDMPFGGMQLLISGDFLQLPPVNGEWVFDSKEWKKINFVPLFLSEPKRFNDTSYFHMLLRIREGLLTKNDMDKLRSRVAAYEQYMRDIKGMDKTEIIKPTKIYPHRARAEEENVEELEELEGEEYCFRPKDSFVTYNPKVQKSHYEEVFDGLAPAEVKLKIGAQVMLTFNVSVEDGLCNGSRGVVISLDADRAVVRFICKPNDPVIIEYQTWEFEDKTVSISRRQMPLILAWAQTIHKSQGSTLDFCVADIGPAVFAEGQAYVALSRARNWESLLLKNFVPKSIKANKKALDYIHYLEDILEQMGNNEEVE